MDDFKLRTLTLNVWGVPFFSAERAERIAAIAAHLALLEPDIVGIQEAWLEKDRVVLQEGAKKAGLVYWHYFASGVNGSGLLLLSRYPLVDAAFLRFRLTSRPERLPNELDYFGGKGIGYARVQTPAGFVNIFDVHPIAQYAKDDADIYRAHRAAAAYEAARFIKAYAHDDYPVILLGDLNMEPTQFPFRLLIALAELCDAYSKVHPADSGYTYSTENPYSTFSENTKRLDYVLYRCGKEPGLKPLEAQVCFTSTAVPKPRGFSDHYGVLVEFASVKEVSGRVATDSDSSLLYELADLLDTALVEARHRRESHLLRFGMSLLFWLGVAFLKRSVFIPARLTGGFYTLLQGWLSFLIVPEEISGLESLLEEVRKQLPPDASIS